MMPGTNPLREPQSRVQGRAFRQATSDKGGGLRWHLVPTSAAAPINLVTVNRRYRRGILSLTGHTGCAVTFSVEETVADAIVPDTGSLRFASSTETIGTVVREPMSASELHGALFGVDGPLQDALFTAAGDRRRRGWRPHGVPRAPQRAPRSRHGRVGRRLVRDGSDHRAFRWQPSSAPGSSSRRWVVTRISTFGPPSRISTPAR